MTERGFFVIMEWDGDKPPTPFYSRMKRLTSRVRGDKGISPIARRSAYRNTAIVMQEGAIYCIDEQLARVIALLAEQYGAKNVSISTVIENQPVVADEKDLEALAVVEKICGARGRPSAESVSDSGWIVYCYSEMDNHHVSDLKRPINCPVCGSFMTRIFPDSPIYKPRTHWSPSKTVADTWMRLRFGHNGEFLPSKKVVGHMFKSDLGVRVPWDYDFLRTRISGFEASNNISTYTGLDVWHTGEKKKRREVLFKIMTSDLSFLDAFHEDIPSAISLLDALYVGQMYEREDRRRVRRIETIVRVLGENMDITINKLAENPDEIDFFDASARLDTATMARFFTDVHAYYQDEGIDAEFYQRKIAVF